MNLASLQSAGIPPQLSLGENRTAALLGSGETSPSAFGGLLDRLLSQVNQQQTQADQAVQNLALGQTDQLHNVLLEVAKADLAFRLALEIRNRLADAYQEVTKMQI